ncbi:MAG: hypothetical protein H6670_11020 [Anaerolineaceae bacterium]|nr:hypothetical protein [Anaerolineaceae bacterium]
MESIGDGRRQVPTTGDVLVFLDALLARSDSYRHRACLTLTAIHPDGQHRTPSCHIPLNRPDLLDDALKRLLATNRLGWGAFVAIGLRRRGLTRYQRGTARDILALPAVFVDLDDPAPNALTRLRNLHPMPSCITFTGGGYHAYWWLDQPVSDLRVARRVLRGLQQMAKSDSLSVVQSLRLPGSRNTKPRRNNALCRIIELHERRYPVEAFNHLLTHPAYRPPQRHLPRPTTHSRTDNALNPALLRVVTDRLSDMGYVGRGDWLSGSCLYPSHHQHDDTHPSFGFNTRTGYGNCFRCGSILLKDICHTLGILPTDYGGLFV